MAELSSREITQRKIADALDYLGENYNIVDKAVREGKATNMDIARSFTGDVKSDKLVENIGLLDLTPLGTYFAFEEGQKAILKEEPDPLKRQMALLGAMRQPLQAIIDRPKIGFPVFDMMEGAFEGLTLSSVALKPVVKFLSSLKAKATKPSKDVGMNIQKTSLPTSSEANTTINLAENQGFDPRTYYHITREDITSFDPNAPADLGLGPKEMEDWQYDGFEGTRGATYFTESKEYLEEIFDAMSDTKIGGSNTGKGITGLRSMPVKLKLRNIFLPRNKEHIAMLRDAIEKSSLEDRKIFNYFKDKQLELRDEYTDDDFFIEMSNYQMPYTLENPIVIKKMKELGFTGYSGDPYAPGTIALFNPEKGDVRSVFAKFDPEKSKDGNILATIIPPTTLGALSTLNDEPEKQIPQT